MRILWERAAARVGDVATMTEPTARSRGPKALSHLIRYDDHVEMSWKNGAGRTREIAREDDDGGLLWRLSLATVAQSGPFSLFPGLDRIIMLVEGAEMTLCFDIGETLALRPMIPRRFSCELPLSGKLADAAPCRDLNLLFRRSTIAAQAQAISFSGNVQLCWDKTELMICFVVSGVIDIDHGNRGRETLHPGDTFIHDCCRSAESVRLSLDGQGSPAECLLFLVSTLHPSSVD